MIVFVTIIVILLLTLLFTYNGLIRKRNAVKQSYSAIDVYLKQRFDLIPNLIEVVKAYAKYEKEMFESITKLRTEYEQTKDLSKATELNSKINSVLLIGENYPELKASENFLNLQKNLTKMEDQLQAARRLYNSDVTIFNTALQVFPTNIIASMFGFHEEKLFEIEPAQAENIKVNI